MRLSIVLALLFLAACALALPGADAPAAGASPITGDEITVTSLDDAAAGDVLPGAASGEAAAPATRPEARPADPEPGEAALAEDGVQGKPPVPAAPKSPAQILCEKAEGLWVKVGASFAMTCIKPTRDAGKQCARESDCDGQCLARSRSCAPFKPLLGCNEVLQDNGARVTLCIQ